MLQSVSRVFVVYRRKTLTGSPDPTHANGTNKPCIKAAHYLITGFWYFRGFLGSVLGIWAFQEIIDNRKALLESISTHIR